MPQAMVKQDFPFEVQQAIQKILEHRKKIRMKVKKRAPLVALMFPSLFALSYSILRQGQLNNPSVPSVLLAGIGSANWSARAFARHFPQFRREYLVLYRAIKKQSKHPAIASLLNNPRARYVIVQNDGNLAARYHSPTILGQPIGRRRLASPKAPKEIRRKWTKKHVFYRKKRSI